MPSKQQVVDPGYRIIEDVLSPHECDYLVHALSMVKHQAGVRHLMSHPAVAAVASDERLIRIAKSARGGKAVPYRATLFEKSVHAKWLVAWHQDRALPLSQLSNAHGWGPRSRKAGVDYAHAPASVLSRIIALRVHLDSSTCSNGPLRIVPGSHHLGVMSEAEVLAVASERDHIECIVGRGGVLAMRPLLIHSSSKSRSDEPRRVLHIEYAESLDLSPGIRLAVT